MEGRLIMIEGSRKICTIAASSGPLAMTGAAEALLAGYAELIKESTTD